MEKSKNKINKKKIVILLIILFSIILIIGLCIFLSKNTKEKSENNKVQKNEYAITVNGDNLTLSGTDKTKIEKDGIEVEKVNIRYVGDQGKIITTLKNNSSEDLNGFEIIINFVDEDDNSVTTIASNISEIFEKGKTMELENIISGKDSKEKIKGAKIIALEKGSLNEGIEKAIDEMDPENMIEE